MNGAFADALDQWTTYFALMGGAAATLLGLLFVAVSLRLNIFHRREVPISEVKGHLEDRGIETRA